MWVIFYLEQTVQGTTLADWLQSPDEGVLGVVEFVNRSYGHPPKQAGVRHAYNDYYWMANDDSIGSGSAKQIPDNAHIKRGLYVDDATWLDVYNNRIMIDPLI